MINADNPPWAEPHGDTVAAPVSGAVTDRFAIDTDGRVMICTGCGTSETVEWIKTNSATAFTCCPERKMVRAISALDEVTRLRAVNAGLVDAHTRLRNGYADAVAGYEYIILEHGRLSGVGFDRVMDHFNQWVTIPESEGLAEGSVTISSQSLASSKDIA